MTDRAQVELPELPEPINGGSRGFGQLWNPLYSEDQMRAYARQVIAESEARAEAWEAFARHQVICADCAESVDFCATGRQLRDTATQAQEAEREAVSA